MCAGKSTARTAHRFVRCGRLRFGCIERINQISARWSALPGTGGQKPQFRRIPDGEKHPARTPVHAGQRPAPGSSFLLLGAGLFVEQSAVLPGGNEDVRRGGGQEQLVSQQLSFAQGNLAPDAGAERPWAAWRGSLFRRAI